jgi:hypothetical protein
VLLVLLERLAQLADGVDLVDGVVDVPVLRAPRRSDIPVSPWS